MENQNQNPEVMDDQVNPEVHDDEGQIAVQQSSDADERLAFAERQAQFYKDQLLAMQQGMRQQVQEEPQYDDDDIISAKDVRSIVESAVSKVRQESVKERNERQLREAREAYSDFDAVIAIADKVITPKMFDIIMADPNPAEFAYWLGKNHYSARKSQQKQVKADPERIKENLSTPKGVSEVSGSNAGQKKSWLTASKEEFEKEKARVLYG